MVEMQGEEGSLPNPAMKRTGRYSSRPMGMRAPEGKSQPESNPAKDQSAAYLDWLGAINTQRVCEMMY